MRFHLALTALLVLGTPARAVPPLVAGDVPTADKCQVEIFLGARYQKSGTIERQIPADEFVVGISRWQELTFELPYLSVSPSQGSSRNGFGDAVIGTKAMFLKETKNRPGMALSLEAKLDNADAQKGLGSGAVDYDIRWRTQKERGWFTGSWNLGYTFVGEPTVNGARQARRDVWFGAFAQEYKVAPRTRLLSEVYWENSDAPGEPSRFAGDIGCKHDFSPALQLQAAIGKSLRQGNLGGPELRIHAGVKIEFSVVPQERR
jgi:hypothetical protein